MPFSRAHRRAPLRRIALFLAMVAFSVSQGVAARDAIPTPDIPPPELCQTAPPTFHELSAILATPSTGGVADATPTPIPTGTPADPETIAGITATLRELVACFNAGDVLRAYGLYTPGYLRRVLANQDPLTPSAYDALATPYPPDDDERSATLGIEGVRLFDDGTAGANVTNRYALIPVPKTFFFTLVREGDRWLIDGVLGEISFSVP